MIFLYKKNFYFKKINNLNKCIKNKNKNAYFINLKNLNKQVLIMLSYYIHTFSLFWSHT